MGCRVELTIEQHEQILLALMTMKIRLEELDTSLLDRDIVEFVAKNLKKTNDAIEAIKGAKWL